MFSTIDVVSSLANFGGVVLFVLVVSGNFYAIVFGQIVGNVAALVIGFLADKSFRKLAKPNFKVLRSYLKYGSPFIPSFLLFWFFSSIDKISLRQFSTFTEIGLYGAAFKIVSVMQLFQSGFVNFWVPVAYEKYESSDNSREFFKKANLVVTPVLFMFGLVVLRFKDLIFLLFAKSYRGASYIAPFLILYPVMYIESETTVMGINFSKKTCWHIIITGVSAFANFVGNTMLVPLLSARGAVISTGLSYVIFFTLRTVIAQRYYSVDFDLKRIYVCTFLTVVVTTAGTFLRNPLTYGLLCALAMTVVFLVYKDAFSYVKKQIKKE